MNIGELSKQSGIPSKTIRYYEDIDLLPKPVRKKMVTASILKLMCSD